MATGASGPENVTVQEVAREVVNQGLKGRAISGVRDPRLSLHLPAGAFDTAVLVIPGGASIAWSSRSARRFATG